MNLDTHRLNARKPPFFWGVENDSNTLEPHNLDGDSGWVMLVVIAIQLGHDSS